MEKLKQTKTMTSNKENQEEEPVHQKKIKLTQEEELAKIQIKSIEKDSLDRVFSLLSCLQEEVSSDEDSTHKKYIKEIDSKANQKKMKVIKSNFVSKTQQLNHKKIKKSFKEDEHLKTSSSSQNTKSETNTEMKKKIGVKSIRKIIRTLCDQYSKEEMDLMIWEVDENLDGYVSEREFEKMYKRCIIDEKEQEPKKLFYLVQFLMYDKEKKGYITLEDTLEILYIRYGDKFEKAIDDIFE